MVVMMGMVVTMVMMSSAIPASNIMSVHWYTLRSTTRHNIGRLCRASNRKKANKQRGKEQEKFQIEG